MAMSVPGITSSSLVDYSSQSVQNRMKQFRQQFQQLGYDLQSGNGLAAQTDLAALQQSGQIATPISSSKRDNQIAKDFKQLAKHLQSGNGSAARKDYAAVQQDFRNRIPRAHYSSQAGGARKTSVIKKLLTPLGRILGSTAIVASHFMGPLGMALRSSKLFASQRASRTVQQAMQQIARNNVVATQLWSPSSSNGISVNA
jgi:hypothetical protein